MTRLHFRGLSGVVFVPRNRRILYYNVQPFLKNSMAASSAPTPNTVLKTAIRAVPAVKYALGVAGVLSVVAIVTLGWRLDPSVAVFGTVLMFVLMTVLLVFTRIVAANAAVFILPVLWFVWSSTLLCIGTAILLFMSVFFKWPMNLQDQILHVKNAEMSDRYFVNVTSDHIPFASGRFSEITSLSIEHFAERYRRLHQHKALAVSKIGWIGLSEYQPSEAEAWQRALGFCDGFVKKSSTPNDTCFVIMINDKKVGDW